MIPYMPAILIPNPESRGDAIQGLALRRHWPLRARNSHKGLFGAGGVGRGRRHDRGRIIGGRSRP